MFMSNLDIYTLSMHVSAFEYFIIAFQIQLQGLPMVKVIWYEFYNYR